MEVEWGRDLKAAINKRAHGEGPARSLRVGIARDEGCGAWFRVRVTAYARNGTSQPEAGQGLVVRLNLCRRIGTLSPLHVVAAGKGRLAVCGHAPMAVSLQRG
jgi:hypothetical protein